MTSVVVLINVVDYVFLFLYLALLVRVVLSWVPGALDSSAGYAIYRITNPILNPLRRLIPPVGGLDITPFIAFLLLAALHRIVLQALLRQRRRHRCGGVEENARDRQQDEAPSHRREEIERHQRRTQQQREDEDGAAAQPFRPDAAP